MTDGWCSSGHSHGASARSRSGHRCYSRCTRALLHRPKRRSGIRSISGALRSLSLVDGSASCYSPHHGFERGTTNRLILRSHSWALWLEERSPLTSSRLPSYGGGRLRARSSRTSWSSRTPAYLSSSRDLSFHSFTRSRRHPRHRCRGLLLLSSEVIKKDAWWCRPR